MDGRVPPRAEEASAPAGAGAAPPPAGCASPPCGAGSEPPPAGCASPASGAEVQARKAEEVSPPAGTEAASLPPGSAQPAGAERAARLRDAAAPPAAEPAAFALDAVALGRLMPMHVVLDPAGRIVAAGPTLARVLRGERPVVGRRFFDLFQLRRPRRVTDAAGLAEAAGLRLHLALLPPPHTAFRGLAVPLAGGQGLIVNLSFGITVAEAVREHDLTDADFAPTDLTVEMLYLAEAKSAVMDELRDLNRRLQGAKTAAEEQALTDTLTGLRNRRALDRALALAVEGGGPFALLHLDLDWFKQVNDSLGHAAGDHVLCEVARILSQELRSADTVARIGGDEFVALLPGVASAAQVEGVARRILARLEAPIPYAGTACRVSASIGIAVSTDYARPKPEQMLADADAALYASKRAGRGRVSGRPGRAAAALAAQPEPPPGG